MQPVRQIGIKEKLANTAVKWSPHAPNVIALGSAENFGVVGKGVVQIKRLEGNTIQTVAAVNEKVQIIWLRMQSSISHGSNSMNSSYSLALEVERLFSGKLAKVSNGPSILKGKFNQFNAHIRTLFSLQDVTTEFFTLETVMLENLSFKSLLM